MNLTAIIAEYNPFHEGHMYHLKESIKKTNADGTIAVLSGNFVQRGEPAMINKWYRTEIALKNGIDLVLELPLIYAVSSAEFFAFGSLSLINSLHIVNNISFGSELGNLDILYNIAHILNKEPLEYKKILNTHLNHGISYAKARTKAIYQYINYLEDNICSFEYLSKILNSSNNILSLEYLKSLLKLNSTIKPITIKRQDSLYNSKELSRLSSATAIRTHLYNKKDLNLLKDFLPSKTFEILNNIGEKNFVFPEDMISFLKYKAISCSENMRNIPEAGEGLHNKIIKSILNNDSYENILMESKSKRYALTRLKRILCQYYIGLDNFPIENMRTQQCPYARVLGFNSKGQQILKEIKNTSSIPIITKIPKNPNEFLKLDILGTNMYSLISNCTVYNEDYLKSPIIIK